MTTSPSPAPGRAHAVPSARHAARLLAALAVLLVSAAGGATAQAAVAPLVWTGWADATGPESAELWGDVDPQGAEATYHFEYGLTEAYGSATPPATSTGAAEVSAAVSGLVPGERYHFRVVAVSGDATVRGRDRTFVAGDGYIPTVHTWTDEIDLRTMTIGVALQSDDAADWHVEYGATPAYGQTTEIQHAAGGYSEATVTLPDLEPGARYHYRVVATNAHGTRRTRDRSFIAGGDLVPFARSYTAEVTSATSARLEGTVDANGHATTYYFEYGRTDAYGEVTPARTATGTWTWASEELAGLERGATYHFRLVAVSDVATVRSVDRTFVAEHAPRARARRPQVTAPDRATLAGAVTPFGDATTYHFEYGPTTAYGSRTPDRDAGDGIEELHVEESLSGLSPGARYHVRLVATNSAGDAASRDHTFVAGAPAARTSGASPVGATTATLRGTVEPHGSTATVWFEWGATDAHGHATPEHVVDAAVTEQDVEAPLTGLAAGAYHYRVVARSAAGSVVRGRDKRVIVGVPTAALEHVVAGSATTADVRAVVSGHGLATTWWVEYTPEASHGADQGAYAFATAPVALDAGTAGQTVERALTALEPSTAYRVRIVARNAAGSAWGASATFTTPAAPPPSAEAPATPPGDAWTGAPPAEATPADSPAPTVRRPPATAPPRRRDPLAPTWMTRGRPAAAPAAPRATVSAGRVKLTVRASRLKGVAGYRVFRRVAGRRDGLKAIRTVKRPGAVVDRSVKRGARYAYVVVAVDRAGRRSRPSKPVRVTVPARRA